MLEPRTFLAAGLSLLALLGACNRASKSYEQITALPYSEWNAFASRLPVEQRLDLHEEIMRRSGHNPQMTITSSFGKEPRQTYAALVRRIAEGESSRFYVPVLFEINRANGFDICSQPDRQLVQKYLREHSTSAVTPADRPRFYTC